MWNFNKAWSLLVELGFGKAAGLCYFEVMEGVVSEMERKMETLDVAHDTCSELKERVAAWGVCVLYVCTGVCMQTFGILH